MDWDCRPWTSRGDWPARGGRWCREAALGYVAELLCLREGLQLLERLVLDLPDPLAGDVERPPHLVKRPRMLTAEPVAKLEHAALAVAEVLECLAQRFLREDFGGPLVQI